mgnify:CR=1 FL=1
MIYPANEGLPARSCPPCGNGRAAQALLDRRQGWSVGAPGAIIGGTIDIFSPVGRAREPRPAVRPFPAEQRTGTSPTMSFRGVERSVQIDAPPGPTIAVNGYGEPLA